MVMVKMPFTVANRQLRYRCLMGRSFPQSACQRGWRSAVTAGRSLRARKVIMAGYPVQRWAGASTAMLMAGSGHPSTCSLTRTPGLTGVLLLRANIRRARQPDIRCISIRNAYHLRRPSILKYRSPIRLSFPSALSRARTTRQIEPSSPPALLGPYAAALHRSAAARGVPRASRDPRRPGAAR